MESTELVTINASQITAKAFGIDEEAIKAHIKKVELLTINGPEDKAGFRAVHDAWIYFRSVRTGCEKTGKGMRSDATAFAKKCLEVERYCIGLVEPTEKLLHERKLAVTKEVERLAAAKLKDRMDLLSGYRSVIPASTIEAMDDKTFSECLEWSRKNYEDARAAEKLVADAEAKRLKEEADAKAAEAQRLADERAKLEAEQAKFRAEQEAASRKLKVQQDIIDAEHRRLIEINRKAEAEAEEYRRQQELERAKAEAAEQARRDEIARRERQRIMDQEAEADAKAEAARREAMRPDREKLLAFITAIEAVPVPEVAIAARPHLVALIEDRRWMAEKFRELIETM